MHIEVVHGYGYWICLLSLMEVVIYLNHLVLFDA
jgi:hypothetical protein